MCLTSSSEQWDSDQDRSIRAKEKLTVDTGPPTRVSIVATPDAMVSPVSGLFEMLKAAGSIAAPEDRDREPGDPFEIEIVGEQAGTIEGPSGLTISAQRSVGEVDQTDVVIVPSMALGEEVDWVPGRYPAMVAWIRAMHERGATVCSACSGGMLTAETGLLDGHQATIHWVSEAYFRERHPEVVLRLDEALVVSGEGGRLVTSGASTAWHDLVLYLVARHVGPATAQALARFHLLQWHRGGQAAFQVFDPRTDHGDAVVLAAQRWIADNYAIAAPVAEMVRRSRLSSRTFKRRFRAATGETTISYVQRIRVERAKRALETGSAPIEEISWAVGYEDPASFRRLFKRVTGLTPGEYRRRFQLPDLPHVRAVEPRAVAYQRTASSPRPRPRHRGRSARDAQPRPRDECPRRTAHRTTRPDGAALPAQRAPRCGHSAPASACMSQASVGHDTADSTRPETCRSRRLTDAGVPSGSSTRPLRAEAVAQTGSVRPG